MRYGGQLWWCLAAVVAAALCWLSASGSTLVQRLPVSGLVLPVPMVGVRSVLLSGVWLHTLFCFEKILGCWMGGAEGRVDS